jgi:hypothetical protein
VDWSALTLTAQRRRVKRQWMLILKLVVRVSMPLLLALVGAATAALPCSRNVTPCLRSP